MNIFFRKNILDFVLNLILNWVFFLARCNKKWIFEIFRPLLVKTKRLVQSTNLFKCFFGACPLLTRLFHPVYRLSLKFWKSHDWNEILSNFSIFDEWFEWKLCTLLDCIGLTGGSWCYHCSKTRFQLILLVQSQKAPNFKVVIEW